MFVFLVGMRVSFYFSRRSGEKRIFFALFFFVLARFRRVKGTEQQQLQQKGRA